MTINWGILGTGTIARAFADALSQTDSANLTAVASRTWENADSFCEKYHHCRAYVGRDALNQDNNIDAVYIATPHSCHAEDAIVALQHGKHVLCEKPLAQNHAQVMATIHTARRHNRFLMEAFMYRLHPQIEAVQNIIADGTVGEVIQLQAQFGYRVPIDEASRLFANELAGGGILDVGCYPVSLAHLLLGPPEKVIGHGSLAASGVDQWAAALLTYAEGKTAQISTAVRLPQKNDAIIFGTKGRIEIPDPWRLDRTGGPWQFDLIVGEQTETITGELNLIYVTQAEHVSQLIADGAIESPVITWQTSEQIANTLDRWRSAVGVEYVSEQQPAPLPPQQKHTGPTISRRRINGLNKSVSSLVMGCDNQPSMAHAAVMFDHFYNAGGNCFDTAFIYGGGSMEKLLGQWHQSRGVRDDLVIVGKGAHSPHCFPDVIGQQLDISLERLATDHVDIYFMHRDNLDVPAGEFIDALNQEVTDDRIGIFGGSNWTLARLKEANDYAIRNNLQPFQALSNQLSLAKMVEPIWDGVHTANEAEFLDYLTEQQMLLMPWSSQARGFFTDWGASIINQEKNKTSSTTLMEPTAEELTRVWFSEENFARRQRAEALADELGVDLINIALAFVINQPFPCLPLVGPRSLQESDSCMSALEISLTDAQVDYLANG